MKIDRRPFLRAGVQDVLWNVELSVFPHRGYYALGFLSLQTAGTAAFHAFPNNDSVLVVLHVLETGNRWQTGKKHIDLQKY